MDKLNVNRNVIDLYYRYKMPRLCTKVEGKGNGIKTVIENMDEVAKAFNRPATYPMKYFGCELGAQTKFDHKKRFIVNGSHDASTLQDLLDAFIRKYVLCPECDNPETDLTIQAKKDKGQILQSCKACGYHGLLKVQHKINTFILKNPPNMNPPAQGSSLTEGKRSKRSKKGNDSNNSNANGDNSKGDDFEALKIADDHEEDGQWMTNVNEDAMCARMQELSEGAKNITISEAEKTEKVRMDLFYEYVKRRRDAGELESVQVQKEVHAEAKRLEVIPKAPLVLAELLLSTNIIVEIKKHRNLLLRFTHEDKKAQKYLIGGIEQIIALNSAKLIEKVPIIFKLFYDIDLLDEKAILDWGAKVSKKYVSKDFAQQIHNKASPFIKWLKEAEEESEDSESDFEISFDDRAKPAVEEEVYDDLNIDEI